MTSRSSKSKKYSVKGPLYLWYIDGNHKFIRYVFSYYSYFHIIHDTYGDMMKKLHTICFFGCQQMEKTKEEDHRKHILTNSLKTQTYRWKNVKPWWPTEKSGNHSSTVIFRRDSTSEWVSEWYLVPLTNISIFTSFFSQILIYEIRVMSCKVGQNSNSLLTTCNS